MFCKSTKKKDIGTILLGFAVLMVGMDLMSGSVSGLKNDPSFHSILTMFENPILGIFAGLILTVIVQSSSASVGILQALTVTGGISFGAAIPIIMGQNIGTCVTALISSISANRNGKRAAMIHLYFNVIAVVIVLSGFYLLNYLTSLLDMSEAINAWGVAAVHTVFKLISVLILFPFYKLLAKLAIVTVKDKKSDNETTSLLDERLLETPSIAAGRAADVTFSMAEISCDAFRRSLTLLDNYDAKLCDTIRDIEDKADKYEDALGSYLVKLSACDMDERDSAQVTKLLHIIGDFERISDHAVNIVESAEEMQDKKISFSQEAKRELSVLKGAVDKILDMTYTALTEGDMRLARDVEALEEVVDDLRDQIKLNHVLRLQKSECTIEHGFILSDILNDFERVSDHCSNIASCVVEISQYDALDMHKYLSDLKRNDDEFEQKYNSFKREFSL